MSNAYEQYQRLKARVDAFGQTIGNVTQRRSPVMLAVTGAVTSSSRYFPLRRITSHRQSLALAPEARQRLLARLQQDDPWRIIDTSTPCVLLEHGCCSLYEHRPLICRIHGFPIASTMIERPDGGQRDCCPLNFTDVPLQDIVPQAIYNLDLVNQTLAAINHLFVQEHQLPDQRITIRQAVLTALTPTTASEAR